MEFIELAELCDKGSSNLAQKDLVFDSGIYPVYGAPGEITKVDFFHQNKPYLGLIKDGAGVGRVMQLPANSSVIGTIQYIFPKESVDLKYLYYLIKYLDLGKSNTGATIPHIYFKDYKKRKVKVRKYSEQKYIGQILELIDSHLKTYKNLLELYDLLIKSRFVELFGDIDCNTKNWPIITLENLAELITDGEHSTPKRCNKGIYLLSARNILNHSLKLDDVDYIDETEYSRISKRVIPKAGDILLSCSGSVGRCCVVPMELKFQLVRSVALIRFKSEITPIFAEYMITSDWFQRQINSLKTASSQANLFQGRIKKLKGFVPDINLQYEFIKVVNQINKLKSDVQKSIDETQLLMDSLMQEYFG